jgi:hypothetical protein
VNEINRHLKEDGFEVNPPRKFHGAWTFYFRAPGGILIEVLHQPEVPYSEKGSSRKLSFRLEAFSETGFPVASRFSETLKKVLGHKITRAGLPRL